MTSASLADEISGLDDWSALDLLGNAFATTGQILDDDSGIGRLLDSEDVAVRERAVFLFGIKAKQAGLCEKFHSMLVAESPNNYANISGLMLAIITCTCPIDLKSIRTKLADLVNDSGLVDEIGNVLIGFILVAYERIPRGDFKGYLMREGRPKNVELEAALECVRGH